MTIDAGVQKIVSEVDSFSGRKLQRSSDLALLLQLSTSAGRTEDFNRLVFLAKFATKTFRIMQRIGSEGEGHDKLSEEFAKAVEETKDIMKALMAGASTDLQKRFVTAYFQLTSAAFANLLALLSDLGWYKNWTIDHPVTPP